MRPYFRPAIALALLLALAALAQPAPILSQVQEGATLTVLRGEVAVVRPDRSTVQPAPSGTTVRAGDEIRTLTQTGALITFFVGTEIEMGADTILVVERVSQQGERIDVSLKQVLGTTFNRVETLTDPGSAYRINAGGAVALVRGTAFYWLVLDGIAVLIVTEGQVLVNGALLGPGGYWFEVDGNRVLNGPNGFRANLLDPWNALFEGFTTAQQALQDDELGSQGLIPGGSQEQRRTRLRQLRRQGDLDSPVILDTATPVPGATATPIPPPGSLAINDVVVEEGTGGSTNAVFTVTLGAPSSVPISVSFSTSNDSATAGSDYVTVSGVLSFAPGETTKTIVVPVIGDALDEATETFFVNLTGATNATIARAQGVGTISDDDSPPALFIDDVSLNEGNAGTTNAVFTVTLSAASGLPVTVNYATGGGTATAGSDYQGVSGTRTFGAGETTKTITVPVIGDMLLESSETFLVNLSVHTIGRGPGVGTIQDDDFRQR